MRSDPHFDGSFGYVTVCTTISFESALFFLPLPRVPGSLLCPVTTLLNHLRLNNVPSRAPLFSVRSTGHVRPLLLHFSSFLAEILKSVGLDSTHYSPHSSRGVGATFAFKSSVPSELIKVQSDWCSDCYSIYLEICDKQKRVAASRMAAAFFKYKYLVSTYPIS